MKLATHRDGSRDGVLHVVSRDLSRMVPATGIAPTLQAAIESWNHAAPLLEERYAHLNDGVVAAEVLDANHLESPLPRAYQFLDGSAYLNHVELVRRARGADMPPSFLDDPLMYQAVSDRFLGPRDAIEVADEGHGIDMEAEVAVIVDDVPMGVAPADAGAHIKLLMLVNDVSLRGLIPGELAKGFGFLHGKPRSAFSPVAVTADELGPAWDGGKVHLPLVVQLNEAVIGRANAGTDMNFDLPRLVAHAAMTRPLAAGTIVGSGTVSNKDRAAGVSCLAEIRTIETLDEGQPRTPFMQFGDQVRIEMLDTAGDSIFGAIDQTVIAYAGP